MATKDFKFTLEDGEHTVHVEHGSFSGKRSITVDGKPLTKDTKFIDTGGEYPFQINAHRGVVIIRNNLLGFTYDVGIDGKSVTTSKPVMTMAPMPGWGWLFVVVCALIPIVAVGGIVPMVLGLAGALACNQIARDGSKDYNTRLLMCAGITVLCWGLFIGFIYVARSVIAS